MKLPKRQEIIPLIFTCLGFVSVEKIYISNTRDRKYLAARHRSNSLLGVWISRWNSVSHVWFVTSNIELTLIKHWKISFWSPGIDSLYSLKCSRTVHKRYCSQRTLMNAENWITQSQTALFLIETTLFNNYFSVQFKKTCWYCGEHARCTVYGVHKTNCQLLLFVVITHIHCQDYYL